MALINSSSKNKSGVSSLFPDLSNLNNQATVTKPSTLTAVNVVSTPKTGSVANTAISTPKAPAGAVDVVAQLFGTRKYKNPETTNQQSLTTNGAVTGALEGLSEKTTSTPKAPVGAAATRPIGTTPGKTTDSPVGTSDETPEVSDNNVSDTSAYEALVAAYQQLQDQRGWYEEQIRLQQEEQKNLLAQQLREQQAQYEAQLKAQQAAQAAAAQNAYNSNIAALQQAYDSRVAGIGKNYDATKGQLESSYNSAIQNLADYYNSSKTQLGEQYNALISGLESDYNVSKNRYDTDYNTQMQGLVADYDASTGALNTNAEKALQEAYINRMLQEKNLRQQLSSYGLTGGASESVMASLLNNYGNSRNNIELERADSLAALLRDYNAEKAAASGTYTNALALLESEYNKNRANAGNNYNQTLAELLNTYNANKQNVSDSYNQNLASALSAYNNAMASADESNMAYRMQLENDLANNIVSSYGNLYNGLADSVGDYNSLMTSLIANQNNVYSSLLNSYYQRILDSIAG